jgi:WD40 repeat-containing protein SMU1
MLKEFRGHTSYVQGVLFSQDGSQVISCSSDATVRVWDAKSCEQVHAFRPPQTGGGGGADKEEPGILGIALHPLHPEQIFVANASSTLFLMTLGGQVVKAMQSGKREGGGACQRAVSWV